MRILVFQRVPFQFIKYDQIISHDEHDVVYVGKKDALETVPADLRCTKVERPGERAPADEIIEMFASGPRFDRVLSMSQYEVVDAARVREALGVEGRTLADVRRADDKVEMKRAVLSRGLRAPRFVVCSEAIAGAEAPWRGKTVLKPVDGTASKDVHVFGDYAAAVAAAISNSMGVERFDPDRFELEEFVEGPIVSCDGLMVGGALVAAIASKYLGTCLGFANGEPLGCIQLPEATAMCEEAASFVEAVGIRNGAFHLEMIEGRDGLVFLEVAARAGGGPTIDLFERVTGINLVNAEIALEVSSAPLAENPGRAHLTPRARRAEELTYGDFMFPGHKIEASHGRVEGGEAFRGHEGIVKWTELAPSAPLPRTVSYHDFELPLSGIVAGRTSAEVEALTRRILRDVRVVAA